MRIYQISIKQYPFLLFPLMAAYAIFWLLTRIPAVNAVFACTTLTRAYRRYHEPDTGVRELRRKTK